MRADPEEYMGQELRRDRIPIIELVLALAVIGALAAYWFWSDEKKPPAPTVEVPPVVAPVAQSGLPQTPDIPQRSEPAAAPVPEVAGVVADTGAAVQPSEPAPTVRLTMQQGDALLLSQLSAAGAKANLKKLVSIPQAVEVTAALIDGLGRGNIQRKLLSASPPSEPFSVMDDGDEIFMNSAGYLRYDGYADAIAALDVSVLVDTFHTLRPLYEEAYGYLGLDPADFDNAVIRTLDLILATPEIGEPIALKPKSVVYIYADPSLEGLPGVQKQLLRMGPDNIRRIKQQARILREGLLAQ
jgi:hypothetical protein